MRRPNSVRRLPDKQRGGVQRPVVLELRPGGYPRVTKHLEVRRTIVLAAAAWLATAGCGLFGVNWPGSSNPGEPAPRKFVDADTPFYLTSDPPTAKTADEPQPPRRAVTMLLVLHVQIPHERRAAAEKVWNHLREDALDSEVALRLRRNGLRVGVGREQWWEAIKAGLDAIEGQRVRFMDEVRLPPAFPLALEMDDEPHDQTLFFVERDGVLSGATWPQSRNVLLVTCGATAAQADVVRLFVAPEVRQRLPGWRWVRTESGVWQTPKRSGRLFDAAGFATTLAAGEFVLLAPSAQAEVYGLIGGALLIREEDGRRYDSYVFLRPRLSHVDQPD